MATRARFFIIATAFLAVLSMNTFVMGQSDANQIQSIDKPYVTAEMITLPATADVASYKLTVKGPDNFHFEREFSGENVPFIDPFGIHGELLADGRYAYQLIMNPKMTEDAKEALRFARVTGDMSEVNELRKTGEILATPEPMYGYFSISEGLIIVPGVEERTIAAKGNEGRNNNEKPGDPVLTNDEVIGDVGVIDSDDGIRDQVILDDLIVDGSACIGFDCVNGEAFGFDTIRLKENNLRIKFDDTSNNNAFPNNDWQLTANDSANGGANKFSLDDITNSRTPFTVEARAPSHSVYVDDGGRVGFGTSTPVANLHVVEGNSPTLRLEQNGSSGFAPQTWDLAGNETNFFLRDVSNGSTLPIRVRPGAATNALYINNDSNVGLGTASPDEKLDVNGGASDTTIKVQSSSGVPQFFAEHTGAVNARREMFVLENYGEPTFRFSNTDPGSADDWSMILLNNDSFLISRNGSGAEEMRIFNGGNVTIGGTLTESSDVNVKENFETVDALEVLDRIADLPITTWNYIRDKDAVRHMGPMAQDFAAAFGLGHTNTGISNVDSTGVMFAAVKGLNQRIDEKDATIDQLEKENADLAKRLNDLEQKQEARLKALEEIIQKMNQPSN